MAGVPWCAASGTVLIVCAKNDSAPAGTTFGVGSSSFAVFYLVVFFWPRARFWCVVLFGSVKPRRVRMHFLVLNVGSLEHGQNPKHHAVVMNVPAL